MTRMQPAEVRKIAEAVAAARKRPIGSQFEQRGTLLHKIQSLGGTIGDSLLGDDGLPLAQSFAVLGVDKARRVACRAVDA